MNRTCATCHHSIVDHLLGVLVDGPGCKRDDCDCDDYQEPAA